MGLSRALIFLVLSLLALLAAGPADAKPENVNDLFQEWLEAFNSGDKIAIQSFYRKRLGDPAAVVALDEAEDTCGFDVVRIETRATSSMTVLLAEKCFPALQRLKIETSPSGEVKLKTFRLTSLALPEPGATTAVTKMADRLAGHDRFAGSLLILHGSERLAARSWGRVDGITQVPISLDTPMFLASAGKMFTAVAVLQLVDAGRIDLDAPLGRYLSNYPNAETANVTIRQLLQHRGGTRDIGILGRNEHANRTRVQTIDDIVALNGHRSPAFPPGSKADYSNYGYVLLGAIVQRVSGKTYYDYITENIFKPSGMNDAGYPTPNHLQGVPTGYTTFFGEVARAVSNRQNLPWRGTPAGGGVASANDMLKFVAALKSGKLLPAPMFKMATTAGNTPWYGMGFVVNSSLASWGHGGNSYGMDVAIHFYPTTDTTFVCLASRDMVCNRLIQAWYRRTFGPTQ